MWHQVQEVDQLRNRKFFGALLGGEVEGDSDPYLAEIFDHLGKKDHPKNWPAFFDDFLVPLRTQDSGHASTL